MTLPITLSFVPGPQLVDGSVLNAMILQINTAFGASPGAGSFTTLSASGAVTGAGFTSLFASPPPTGSTAANTGKFTTAQATSLALGGATTGATLDVAGTATISGQVSLGGVAGAEGLRVLATAGTVNWLQVSGAVNTGFSVIAEAAGANTNIQLLLASKGNDNIVFRTNGSGGSTQAVVTHTAGADRTLTFTGGVSGSGTNPTIGTSGGALALGPGTAPATLQTKSSKTALNGTWATSSAGLATGDLWNNTGVINVA